MIPANLVNPQDANVTLELIAKELEVELDIVEGQYHRSLSLFAYIADLIGYSYDQMASFTGKTYGEMKEAHYSLAKAGNQHIYMKGCSFGAQANEIAKAVLARCRKKAEPIKPTGKTQQEELQQIGKDIKDGLYTMHMLARQVCLGRVAVECIVNGAITAKTPLEYHRRHAGRIIQMGKQLRKMAELYNKNTSTV